MQKLKDLGGPKPKAEKDPFIFRGTSDEFKNPDFKDLFNNPRGVICTD